MRRTYVYSIYNSESYLFKVLFQSSEIIQINVVKIGLFLLKVINELHLAQKHKKNFSEISNFFLIQKIIAQRLYTELYLRKIDTYQLNKIKKRDVKSLRIRGYAKDPDYYCLLNTTCDYKTRVRMCMKKYFMFGINNNRKLA